MPSKIEISIEARDNASAVLDGVRNKLQIFDQFGNTASDLSEKVDRTSRSLDGVEVSTRRAERGIRALVLPIATELSPALGKTGSALAEITRGASLLGGGFGVAAVAASSFAALMGAQVLDNISKARMEMSAFAKALESGQLDRVSAQVEMLSDKIITLSENAREAARHPWWTFLTDTLNPSNAVDRAKQGLNLRIALDEQVKARAEERVLRENTQPGAAPGYSAAEYNAALGTQARETFAIQQSQRGLFDFALPGPDAALIQALRQAQDLERQGQDAAAARLRTAAQAQYQRTRGLADAGLFARPTPGAVSDYDTGPFFGEAAQGQVRELAQSLDTRALQREVDLLRNRRETLGENAVSDYGATVFGPTASAAVNEQNLATQRQELEIAAQRADVASKIYGLTAQEVAARQLQMLDLRTAAALDDERLTSAQKALVVYQNQAAAYEIIQREAERTNAVAGLRRGLADVEEQFGATGTRMQDMARTLGGDIGRDLSDSIAGPIEERLQNLPPLFRSVLTSILRAITDDIGKQIVGQLFGGLKSLLPGGGPAGSLPFGSGGGGGGPLGLAEAPTGGPTQITVNVAGRPLSESELQIASQAAGEAGVLALKNNQATVVSGQFIPQSTELQGITPQVLSTASTTRPESGFLTSALPIAGNALAFGSTAFGATGARTGLDVGASAALGGLTGAGLGRSIGNLFGEGSIGAGTGALAGAAVNTTLALLAKQEADKQAAKARQQAEIGRAAGAGSDLVQSASAAQSLPDFIRRLTAFGSGYTGGTANPAVPTSVQTPQGRLAIGAPNPTYPVATLEDILANPGSIQANIQAGVDPSALAGPNAATSSALQAMATDLVNSFRKTEQGVGVTQEERLPGTSGLRRRTTVPAGRASALGTEGGAIAIDQLALGALSDDDKAALLLDVLNQVGQDRDIVSTISDGATGTITSITRIPKSTIALPPATTPVPAPVTPPGTVGQTPPLSTGELLTAGGAISLGLATQLADPKSILNAILPAGYTGPELATALSNLFTTGLLSGGAGSVALGDLEAAGRDLFTPLSDLSTTPGVGFGDALAGLGGLSGLYNLVLGAQAADPASIVQGALSVYSALSSIAPATFTPISTVLGSAFATIAPETAAALTGTTVGATTGAEVASAAIAAAAPWIAVAAPILFWAAMKLTEPGPSDAWAIVGSTATALQTAARTSIAQANATFAALRSQRITDPTMIQGALSMGANALYNYYRGVQNPRGGVISVATFYAYTKQDPTPLQNAAALLQQNMKDAIAELSRQGVSMASLGNLAPAAVGSLIQGQPYSDAIKNAQKIVGGGLPIYQSVAVGEGETLQDTGWVTQPTDQTQNVNLGISAAGGRLLPVDTVNAEYGGPLWSLMRYLAGPSAAGYDVQTPTITGAQPWLPSQAAPGTISGPTATEAPLADWEIQQLLAIAATIQGAFTAGGGDAGATGIGPAGQGTGTAGTAAGADGSGPW